MHARTRPFPHARLVAGRFNPPVVILATVVTAFLVALLGAPRADAAGPTVNITGTGASCTAAFCYQPDSLTVRSGDSVTWTNGSSAPHTVARCTPSACSGQSGGTGTDAGPSTGTINPGAASSPVTFAGTGTYVYYCTIHGYAAMHGTITVEQAAATSSGPGGGNGSPAVPSTGAAPLSAPALLLLLLGVALTLVRRSKSART